MENQNSEKNINKTPSKMARLAWPKSKYGVIFAIIVLLALAYVVDADISYRLGYIYGIIAAFLGTLFTIFNARLIKNVDAAKITMLEMLSGTILLSILFLFQYDYTIFL